MKYGQLENLILTNDPIKHEHIKQAKKKADRWCRHLKKVVSVQEYDHAHDESYEHIYCDMCKVAMTEKEVDRNIKANGKLHFNN